MPGHHNEKARQNTTTKIVAATRSNTAVASTSAWCYLRRTVFLILHWYENLQRCSGFDLIRWATPCQSLLKLVLVFIAGSLLFMISEGWSATDGFYFSIITCVRGVNGPVLYFSSVLLAKVPSVQPSTPIIELDIQLNSENPIR